MSDYPWCGLSSWDKNKFLFRFKKYLSRRHNYACMIHDKTYERSQGERLTADLELLFKMRSMSKSMTRRLDLRLLYLVEDYLFYYSVRVIGSSRWGKK